MPGNIILIGFMGVGKGRTARALAKKTSTFVVDTDDLIESMVNMKIRKIFAKHGESFFRKLEILTANWLEKNVTNTIVSTGGGFFQVPNINRLGTVVFLHSSLEGILAAFENHPHGLKKLKKRPLLKDLDKASELYNKRLPLYREVADYEINMELENAATVSFQIINKCWQPSYRQSEI